MIKRTLFFSNPAYLSTKHQQLYIRFPEDHKEDRTVPIEDIGMLILENQQITLTNGLITKLIQNKTAIVNCDQFHLPISLLQPLNGHSEQMERIRYQMDASIPLKKNLWQQTITYKIRNQAHHLKKREKNGLKLINWSKQVKSGDLENHEGVSAAYYWQHLFDIPNFNRTPKGISPNHLLNYGYAILRASTARAIIASGLLPNLGIFHRNKYNAYCLADDLMEPYRIYVDDLVYDIIKDLDDPDIEMNTELKMKLLQIPVLDVTIEGQKSPLMNALSRTTTSLFFCLEGSSRRLLYPEFNS
ncbi:type II CRISPR-associated endonuclease Cas1 [Psychroflexus lacisalsi]|jgi:CRISPR-associated protein Cas1|uniref:CRISPR-associated endonuclease Cas1 n=1 Tax=Psychroflexus lacisalsi TaxID=503928 RepID=A0ABP3VGD3_9FLAO|nr:type II CRISPR-associated endonuclease Cas1 [Psychroflexus lacisalsi]MBZ9619557.1 type II CRISPR-associated endonuclease Cas1 [Psychroflexus lacisalsi]